MGTGTQLDLFENHSELNKTHCDICGDVLELWCIDAPTVMGPWAHMCIWCWTQIGVSTSMSTLFVRAGSGWKKVRKAHPSNRSEFEHILRGLPNEEEDRQEDQEEGTRERRHGSGAIPRPL